MSLNKYVIDLTNEIIRVICFCELKAKQQFVLCINFTFLNLYVIFKYFYFFSYTCTELSGFNAINPGSHEP